MQVLLRFTVLYRSDLSKEMRMFLFRLIQKDNLVCLMNQGVDKRSIIYNNVIFCCCEWSRWVHTGGWVVYRKGYLGYAAAQTLKHNELPTRTTTLLVLLKTLSLADF